MPYGSRLKPGLSAPVCLSSPAAVLGTAPNDPDPSSQIFGVISPNGFYYLHSISYFDALDNGLGDRLDPKHHGLVFGVSDVTHHDFLRFMRWGIVRYVWIAVENESRGRKPGPDVQMQASTGGAAVVAPPQAFEYPVAGQLFCQKAGQAAVSTKRRSAGITGPGTALVVVAVADHAHPMAQRKAISHQPFKGTPPSESL